MGGRPGLDAWVKKRNLDILGMNELNNWQRTGTMERKAASMGFGYSHLMVIPSGYHMGIMASTPVQVVAELKEPTYKFERGALHCIIAGIHVILVHLHAHSAVARAAEATLLLEHINATTTSEDQIIVMGDFNTLSILDARACRYNSSVLKKIIRLAESGNPILANKLLTKDRHAIAYTPHNTFLEAGYKDLLRPKRSKKCLATEPTSLGSDQAASLPLMRVDYILGYNIPVSDQSAHCDIVTNAVTQKLSDHFPTICDLQLL